MGIEIFQEAEARKIGVLRAIWEDCGVVLQKTLFCGETGHVLSVYLGKAHNKMRYCGINDLLGSLTD